MKFKEFWKEFVENTNWEGFRCTIKGDPSIREIKEALNKQKEIDKKQCKTC